MSYITLGKFKSIKGFFKKRVAGEFLIFAINDDVKSSVIFLQFFQEVKKDFYIVGILGGFSSPDKDAREEIIERFRYDATIDILEEKIPAKIKIPKITFTKPSKYLGNQMELFSESRLPDGYFILKCKVKKGFEPVVDYEGGGSPSSVTSLTKQMRSFSSSRIKNITKI